MRARRHTDTHTHTHTHTHTAPVFGPLAWELPPQTGVLPDGPDRYKHFARLLLEGKVVNGFSALAPWLNDRPTMLARTWATPKVRKRARQHAQREREGEGEGEGERCPLV